MREATSQTIRCKRLREVLTSKGRVLIVAHDYPDPDCLASAWGLQTLLKHWGLRSTIAYGGFIGRAENRSMINLLRMKITPIANLDLKKFSRIVSVDCSPGSGNVSLPAHVEADAVIDHHPPRRKLPSSCFADIRTDTSATSALIISYLTNARCTIPAGLATALYYGIKTDTREALRDMPAAEKAARKAVTNMLDYRLLWNLENPPRDRKYFQVFRRALSRAKVQGRIGHVFLGRLASPDFVAEIADFFATLDSIDWMIAAGIQGNQLFFSIRGCKTNKAYAVAELIARHLGGNGGGHGQYAAGRIPLEGKSDTELARAFAKTIIRVFRISDTVASSAF